MFVSRIPDEKAGLREQARALRRRGTPYKRIAEQLGVSTSTAFAWTRDIELTPEQVAANLRRSAPQTREAIARRSRAWAARSRARRAAYQAQGRRYARESNDPLHRAGCMLYWAEGRKDRNCVRFSNSDVAMVAYFRRFLTECFDVPVHKLSLSLHVYLNNELSLEAVEEHWLQALALPRSCLRKHQINPLPKSSKASKRNRLPYGVGTLSYCNTAVVQHIYGAIQEYAGLEGTRWLD